MLRSFLKVLRLAVIAAGVLALVGLLWIAAGWSTGIDRWLDVTEPATPSAAIVVLGGGTGPGNLPLSQGWDRILTAERLFRDGLAPVVIFTGSGGARVSQSEIYANAAEWMGIPRSAMMLEATAPSTADHGFAILEMVLPGGARVTTDTPLLVVTSTFHSRRALMAFARAGFTRVRIVSRYVPAQPASADTPEGLVNTVDDYRPSTKRYDDVLLRLAYGSFDFFVHVREAGAILVSRVREGS